MKNSILIIPVIAALISPITYAEWGVQVEDDLFTGGKKAVMVGTLVSNNNVVIFDCTKNKLSVAYIEENGSSDLSSDIPMDLILKIDGNDATKLNANLSRRNARNIQVQSVDSEKITVLLRQLQNAKSKLLIGMQTKDGEIQTSYSANVARSTQSVTSFVNACEIKL